MGLMQNSAVIFFGFLVWLIIAPRRSNSQYSELFLAYMAALLFCLIGTSEIITIKPVAFFFTVGGVLAFICVILRQTFTIVIKK